MATAIIHQDNHSYWILLTVAVLIRPAASIPVRMLNRLAGTLLGVLLAVVMLIAVAGEPWIIAAIAAVALGFAVAAASRLYAFTVVGLTCSTLLSALHRRRRPRLPGTPSRRHARRSGHRDHLRPLALAARTTKTLADSSRCTATDGGLGLSHPTQAASGTGHRRHRTGCGPILAVIAS